MEGIDIAQGLQVRCTRQFRVQKAGYLMKAHLGCSH